MLLITFLGKLQNKKNSDAVSTLQCTVFHADFNVHEPTFILTFKIFNIIASVRLERAELFE